MSLGEARTASRRGGMDRGRNGGLKERCVYWPVSKQEKGRSVKPKLSLKPRFSPVRNGPGDFLPSVSQVAVGDNV